MTARRRRARWLTRFVDLVGGWRRPQRPSREAVTAFWRRVARDHDDESRGWLQDSDPGGGLRGYCIPPRVRW